MFLANHCGRRHTHLLELHEINKNGLYWKGGSCSIMTLVAVETSLMLIIKNLQQIPNIYPSMSANILADHSLNYYYFKIMKIYHKFGLTIIQLIM